MANLNAQPSTPAAQPLVTNDVQATPPADNALDDVCVIEGDKIESTEMIQRPPLGETREVSLEDGHNYIFGFNQADAESFTEQDGTLTITFDCGGKLVLKNYHTVTTGDDASTFAFSDVVPQGELASLIKVVDTTDEKVEEPETVLRKAERADGEGDQNVANIEPAAGDQVQSAQKLAQIQPAAGDAAGGTQNSGYGFNTTYNAEPVGPLDAVGPLGATALRYGANFREPNPLIGEEQDNNPLEIGPNAEFVDETNLSNGPIVETGNINIDYGNDGPGSIGPNGNFSFSGSATNNALTSNGFPVVVTADPNGNGYIGVANGVTIFKLEISSPSGAYTFTLFGTLDHADGNNPDDQIALKFGIIAKDGDGDAVSTSVTVVVADDAPTIETDGTKTIDEDDLGPVSVNGDLVEDFGSDGQGNIHTNGTTSFSGDVAGGVLSSGGVPIVITHTANGYVGQAGGVDVFTLTINPTTGAYTFTLIKPFDHTAGNGTNTIQLFFGVEIEDYDGDKDTTNICINIQDDVPHLTDNDKPTIGHGLEIVDETNLGPITVNGDVDVDFGGDGPGSFGQNNTFSFTGSAENNALTSHGVPVVVTATANGYVGQAGGVDIFKITINADGTYSFTLFGPLDHADKTNPDDVIRLSFGISVTDKDGDKASGQILVDVKDDGPSIVADAAKTIDEDDLGPAVVNGDLTENFGHDGPGNIHPNGTTSVSGDVANGTLTSGGVAVVITQTANGYVGKAGGADVFTLTINPQTGAYTFTLIKPLDHTAGNGANNIQLKFGAEIVDYDGDKAATTITINVKDDVPHLTDNDKPTIGHGLEVVDETNLGPITVEGEVDVDFGGDGPGHFGGTGVSSFNGSAANNALTSHGAPVTITGAQMIDAPFTYFYTGTANGQVVFELRIAPDGSYKFIQYGVLDHADGNNPDDVIQLQFGIQVTDKDGDSANGSIKINIHDDGPQAVDDGNFTDGQVLNGNVLANDDFGSDGPGAVIAVTFNGTTTPIPAGQSVVIVGQYGTLTLNSNGTYQYVPKGGSDGTDVFTYKMDDYDDDTSTAKLTIRVDNDDQPILIDPAVETVDETNLGPIVETGVVQGQFGTDGPGTFSMNGDFSSSGSQLNGALTSNGVPIIVISNQFGYFGQANGVTVFSLTINPQTGAYEFKLFDTLDHADGNNPNDIITLKFGVTGTDNDGDTDTATITVNVLDDAPTIVGDGAKNIDEDDLTPAVVNGNLVENFGHDGQGNIHPNGQTSATGDVANGTLSAGGVPVVITQTANGYVGKAGGVDVFTLTINPATGAYTFTLIKALDHTAGNGANNITLKFGAEIVDYDGDKAHTDIIINVKDDVPTLPCGCDPVIGNGYEIVDETNLGPITVDGKVPVDFGGDGPGQFGGNGSFTYGGSTLGGQLTSHGVSVVVTQTATGYVGKANGVDVFTLTINNDGTYSFKLIGTLDHKDATNPDDIINLNFGIKVTDKDGDTAEGHIKIDVKDDGPHAVDDGNFTDGQVLNGNVLANDDFGSDGPGAVISVTFNGQTTNVPAGQSVVINGTYGTLTLNSNGTYQYVPKGGSDGTDVFTYKMDDYDNDTSSAKLTIKVDNDDCPILIKPATEVVDETNLGPIVETGKVTGDFGNDGPGKFTVNGQFSSDGSKLNNALTSHGVAVVVTQTANGYVGTANGKEVFTLTLQEDGNYTFTLKDVLDHADGNNPNDVISLKFGVKGTDTDGDSDTTTITVNVLDDAPTAHDDGNFTGGQTLNGNVLTNDSFGHDGPGAVVSVTFNGQTTNIAAGQTVVLVGQYGTLTLNSDGTYQYVPKGGVQGTDQFTYKMDDYDNDTSSAKLTIQVDNDDCPILIKPATEVVDETNLGPIVETGKVTGDFGNDGPGKFTVNGQFSSDGSKLNNALTSHGVAVVVTQTANGYVGTANGKEVFTLTLQQDGNYTFTLKDVLDHADANDPNDVISLHFGVKGTDTDGDSDTTTITVKVLDDAPVANDDVNSSHTSVATGNVVTGQNGGPGAADDLSNDTSNKVTKISFGNTTVDVPSSGQATIQGAHGTLKISADGSYTYTSNDGGTDQFKYTLKDGDGDTDTAKLTLSACQDTNVDIKVNNGVDKICIKEDSQGTVPVHATYGGGDGDEILTLKVTGINTSWTVTAPGWTNAGNGVYTLTLPAGQKTYDGNFTFKPPANSDIDMKGLKFTATVFDPDTNTSKSDSEDFTVQVDAVVDTPTLTVPSNLPVQNWYVKNTGYKVDLGISSKVTDTDGSEIITKITIDLNQPLSHGVAPFTTLDSMGIGLNKGTEVSPGIWEITVNAADAATALNGLQLVVPNNKDYWQIHNSQIGGNESVNIVVKTFVKEKVAVGDGNGECDFTDNETCIIKSFCLTFRITPLVLDLDGNGIDLVDASAGVQFDMNNDGKLDKTSWVKGSDGFLALDNNHDGLINNQSELFGNGPDAKDGFADLAKYDSNHDGKIDTNDAVFKDLIVWKDLNQDGISQDNEKFSLKDLGITSINVNATESDITIGDSYISHTSTYTMADGQTHAIVDANFNVIDGKSEGAVLDGTDGKDIIYGTATNDVIVGHAGTDVLFGNGGDDVFVFNTFDGSVDTIKDFDAGDVLDVSGLLQGYDPVQDSINDFVFRTEVNGNTVISIDATGHGDVAHATAIAVIEGATGLDLNDIIQAQQANV